MKTFREHITEAARLDPFKEAKGFNNWVFPTPEQLSWTATNLDYDLVKKTAQVIDLPAYLYKKDRSGNGLFEPFTKKDITDELLDKLFPELKKLKI